MIPKNCHLWLKQNITRDDFSFEIVKKYWDHSHSWRFLSKCKDCGQLYINDSVEFVDREGGNDEIFTLIAPVSEDELVKNDFNHIPPKELFSFLPVIFWAPDNKIRWIRNSQIIPNLNQYKSVSEWYHHFKDNGYSIPLALCNGLTKVMEKYHINFDQAFRLLEEEGKIVLAGRAFIYDLTGDNI